MNSKKDIWVVTDLDGTLMDHSYDLSPALDTLKMLKELGIPVIPCTSKTASEVRSLRNEVGLKDPFIVENGGAIYGDKEDSSGEWRLVLGQSYESLRPKLDLISNDICYPLKALNDLSFPEIELLTGLQNDSISKAVTREWSVPFLNAPEKYWEKITKLSDKYAVSVYKGNRMSHLLGKGSHKGQAVTELKKYLGQNDVKVIALGDSQNDIPLLTVADKAVVIPGPNGPNSCFLEGIKSGKYLLAPFSHAKGWAVTVSKLIESL